MPASSISSIMTWGAYLGAMLTLTAFLAPAALGTLGDMRDYAAASTVDSIRVLIDALRPGDSVYLTFAQSGNRFSVLMSGHSVGYDLDNSTTYVPCRWKLETAVLYPSREYLLTLVNGTVGVSTVGGS